jgi:hypothetical protein
MIAAIVLFASATVPSPHEPNPCDDITQNVWDSRFMPGQRWSYHSRSVDAGSTLIITKIDNVPEIGMVVHIEVNHVDFHDVPPHANGNNSGVERLTMRRDSLDASVVEIIGSTQVPSDFNSYRIWQKNCREKTYATTVADTLTILQSQYCVEMKKRKWPVPACPYLPSIPLSIPPSVSTSNPNP